MVQLTSEAGVEDKLTSVLTARHSSGTESFNIAVDVFEGFTMHTTAMLMLILSA